MDDWEKVDETSLPEKYKFYSNLNIQDITDTDYMHAKKVCEDFETTKLGKNHGLYIKSDILLLIDVLNTLKKCLEKLIIYILQSFFQLLGQNGKQFKKH